MSAAYDARDRRPHWANFPGERPGASEVCVTCVSTQLQTALAETGRFFTVVPASYLRFRSDKDSLRIVPVDLHIRPPPIGIATMKNRMVSPVTKLFIECARAVARDGMLSERKGKTAGSGAAQAKSKF